MKLKAFIYSFKMNQGNRLIYLSVILMLISCSGQSQSGDNAEDNYRMLRGRMVETQIIRRGVSDTNVLAAMREVPRHLFVPEKYRRDAYSDGPLPIGSNQTISQPYIVAIMTELLQIDSNSKVLEIGTGSGYQAAVLAEITDSVYTIEIIPSLAERADSLLDSLGYDKISVRAGDGYLGWPDVAPFDAVIVTAAAPKIPQPLVDQLKTGGRMIIPVGEISQDLMVITKRDDGIIKKSVIPVRFVPMTGEIRED